MMQTIRAEPIKIDWRPELSIFASETFLKTVSDEYGWIGGVDSSGNLRCVLPYTVIRKGILRMVRFRVETIPWGGELDVTEEETFLTSAVEYFRTIGADVIIPAPANSIFRTYPHGGTAAPYGSYVIDLSKSEEILWSNVHPKHRNKIRMAMKNGVEIRSGIEHVNTAYELVKGTLKRSKLGFMDYKAFKRLVLNLDNNVKVIVADHQGAAQGCAVIPFSGYGAYYLYGGSISEPLTGAMNLLHWEAIRQFRALGVKRYDFVGVRIDPQKGTKQEGLMMFKQRFGGELSQGYMWKYALSPLKSALYSLAVRVLRGGDIVDQECHKLSASHLLWH